MTAISCKIFDDAEAWIRENVPDMAADSVACVYPITEFNAEWVRSYRDDEDDERKACTMADHVKALQLLCEQIGRTLFVGGIKSPVDLIDAGNWDAEAVDAYWQLVYRGEVIYG